MKKLLIASSVLAALSMGNVAFAGSETTNGGTIEFIGEITDSTCVVSVKGTDNGTGTDRTNNTVILPTVQTANLAAAGNTAGRTGFVLLVGGNPFNSTKCNLGKISERNPNGTPTGNVIDITKVRAIFGGPLNSGSTNNSVNPSEGYDAAYFDNVDTTTGNLKNIADATNTGANTTDRAWPSSAYPGATKVQLQILDKDGVTPIPVGDSAAQLATSGNKFTSFGNTPPAKPSQSVGLQYYVQYYAKEAGVTAGMVRGFVSYDLDYQ